jgi:quercetin dioxygenase-like cupin family protein
MSTSEGAAAFSPSLRQQVRFLNEARHDEADVLQIEVTQEPGLPVPPHVHPVQEERFHVLEGTIALRIDGRRLRLGAGESAMVPAGTAHSFRVCGGGPARLVNEFRPGLRTDGCFVETFALDRSGRGMPAKLFELTRIARRYPREFLFYVPGVDPGLQRKLLEALGAGLARLPAGRGRGDDGAPEGNGSPTDDGSRIGGPHASRWLAIYMNDQLAAGVVWREMARRAAQENRGSDGGAALSEVAKEIAEDVQTFRQIMRRLDVPERRVKVAAAIVAERVGRLKLNGTLVSYSRLSRFVELDFLAMGIEGKKILWSNLRDLAHLDQLLPAISFDRLIERAEHQRELIEPHRRRAGETALELVGSGPSRDGAPAP